MSQDDDVIASLPSRLGAANAVQLGNALHAAFESQKGLDGAIKRAGRSLWGANDALRVAWEARVRASIMQDGGASARRADVNEDAVWLALYRWLEGWAALPVSLEPDAAKAAAILRELFPSGVEFTDLTYAMEWAEAERRLEALRAGGHVATIESLGGGPLLKALRRAHEAYEQVLGITRRATMPPDPANDALTGMAQDVREAIVAYVTAVTATRDAGDERTRAVCEALLAPIRTWKRALAQD